MNPFASIDILKKNHAVIAAAKEMLSASYASTLAPVYVGRGIGVVKELREIYYNCKNNPSASDEEKGAIKELIAKLVRHLSNVPLNVDDERARRYAQILSHYRFAELGDDKSLVAEFERARQSFTDHPGDGRVCVWFGWILHDCLAASYGRLKNVKLTRFFLNEFENWAYSGDPNLRDDALDAIRGHDIDKAKAFLCGPGDALAYVQQRDWKNALLATAIYIKRNSDCDMSQAYRVVKEAGWHLLQDDPSALMSLLHDGVEVWGGFGKKSARYSYLLGMATAAMSKALKQSKSDMGRFLKGDKAIDENLMGLSKTYISFVCQWGIGNLTKEDRDDSYSAHGRRLSLAGRVVLTLLRCATVVRDVNFLAKEKWMLIFAEKEGSLFNRNVAIYLFKMADVYYVMGDMEKSRVYAIQLVRDDQSEGWRWRVLARTYSKDSQERNDCLARAMSFEECKAGARFGTMVDAWFDGSIKKFSDVKLSDEEITAAINERVQAKAIQDLRAEALLIGDATRYKGVILTRFDEVRKKSARGELLDNTISLRIWWSDDNGAAKTDFVAFSAFEDIDAASAGAPVWVLVASEGNRDTIVKVLPRPDARPFDIYPYLVGLVVERNESRHVISVEYSEGKIFPVNIKRLNGKAEYKPGDLCRVALLERPGMTPLFLDIERTEEKDALPSFSKEFSGIITRKPGSRDARVGDVIIPAGVYSREMVGAKAYGMAASILAKNGARMWRAVTVSTTPKDLEVRP